MKWSLTVARIRGVPLRIHWSFVIFLVLIAVVMYVAAFDPTVIGYVLALVLTIFAFVFLHELAHVGSAKMFGVGTRSITLHPLGGVSMLERVPDKPLQEAFVGAAGPLVNIALAAAILPFVLHFHGAASLLRPPDLLDPGTWMLDLFWINVLLGVFNLLPAFPLDGGRVLRALLATWISYARSTRVTAFIGRLIAIAFVVIGLFISPVLVLIGIFVFFGAAMEERSGQMMGLFARMKVSQAMRTDVPEVVPRATLDEVVTRRDPESDLPVAVVEAGRFHGLIDAETLRFLQPRRDRDAASVMRTGLPTLTEEQDLSYALRHFAGGGQDAIAVVEPAPGASASGKRPLPRLVGVVTTRDMELAYRRLRREAIARREERRRRRRGGPPLATGSKVVRGDAVKDSEPWVPEGPKR